jgi:hypothetical protein
MVKDPERLVVDLEGIEFNSVLESLSNKVAPDDPNIKLLRAGRYKPGVVRLVMELKGEVNRRSSSCRRWRLRASPGPRRLSLEPARSAALAA